MRDKYGYGPFPGVRTIDRPLMADKIPEPPSPRHCPLVGVGTLVLKGGKVLLGKRKGAHGAGEWAFPGGHLEHMETAEDCIRRELAEECGIEVHNVRFQYCANVRKYAPRHYVHLGFVADWKSGEPKALEPDKCEGWEWFDLFELPEPLFEFARMGLDNLTGLRPFQER